MWASNYWADRFWAPRYWCKVGGSSPIPPVPPTPTTVGGFVSGTAASNAGKGLFTGIYRPQQKRVTRATESKQLSRREKRLLKQSKSPSKIIAAESLQLFPKAPDLLSVIEAKEAAKALLLSKAKREEERNQKLQQAKIDILFLEAQQLSQAQTDARNVFLRQQDEVAILLMLDDL